MRKLHIAYGNSCFAKKWSNKEISFEELCERLKTTVRTSETIEEYPKLSKDERNSIKDIGGFVGGELKDNRRKGDNVISRSMLTLDVDEAKVGFIEEFTTKFDKAYCLYSTHRHKPEAPRVRIIIPLTRDITPEEYTAITRYFANTWGIDQFDECSYKPHQLMYWPTTSSNGEYVYKENDTDWMNPDVFLEDYPNWKDCSLYPTSSRESIVRKKSELKQKNPLDKSGVVGAFCRTYTITEVIDKYLSDVYEPSVISGRYNYIPAESSAGMIVYDDVFAYSHHATDPACGKLLNAFDLVRIHKFGDDEKESLKQMMELASNDEDVKLLLTEEKIEESKKEFKGDWKKQLNYMPRTGVLENSVWNLLLILNNDPDFKNFAFNEMVGRIELTGKVSWERPNGNQFWRDADTAQIKAIIDTRYIAFSNRNHDVAFTKTVDDRHFHPVRNYLDNLPEWDGVKRVERLFIDNLQADDTEYVKDVTRKTFAGAVARIYEPGTKFDCIPVLDGDQGIGKSTILKDLIKSEYYSDSLSLNDLADKTAAEKLQGFWIIEIGELAGMKKAEIEKVRAFLSCADDKYRPSYGKTVESHPRQCIIVATVNGERGYLRDITGNRRYWIIKCHKKSQVKEWSFSKAYIDQFWAEAKAIYKTGIILYLIDDILLESQRIQKESMEHDDRVGMVEEYLEKLLPDEWDTMTLYERRNYLSGNELNKHQGKNKRDTVTNAEIWSECFCYDLSSIKTSDSYSLAALMIQIPGWERTTIQKRIPIYGKQRVYVRSK